MQTASRQLPRLTPLATTVLALVCLAGQPFAASGNEPAFYFEVVHIPGSTDWVATREVTQKQYQEITGETPSAFPGPAHPVDSVSWDDAEAFCERLTARERLAGRLPQDLAYELPTDAQWDAFAAGASLDGAVTSLHGEHLSTAAAGSSPPTALGLYDVLGNVWEWCRDWYDNDIRKKDANKDLPAAYSDAQAAALGPEQTFKVLRGGAWDTGPTDGFTPASRLRYAPGMSNYRTGFRCVIIKSVAKRAVTLPHLDFLGNCRLVPPSEVRRTLAAQKLLPRCTCNFSVDVCIPLGHIVARTCAFNAYDMRTNANKR